MTMRSIISSLKGIFCSTGSNTPRPAHRRSVLRVESLEGRDLQSGLTAAQVQTIKVSDFRTAVSDIAAAQQVWQAYQTYKTIDIGTAVNRAVGDLNAAKNMLQLSNQALLYQYNSGYESLSVAVKDQAVLNTANQLAQNDINYLFSSPGYLGALDHIDGQYVGDLPNYFAGSNMMQS